jgi:hypothetical protein
MALASGNNNIALGTNAGSRTTTGTGNIVIGSNGALNESNVMRIGTVQTKHSPPELRHAHFRCFGCHQLARLTPRRRALGALQAGYQALADAPDKLAQLQPVSYQYRTEPDVRHFGLIAEEVDKVTSELVVVHDKQNRPGSV